MAGKTNTTSTVNGGKKEKLDAELKRDVEKAKEKFSGEPLVPFAVPKALEKYIGTTLFISVNGVYVNVPVDGETHQIPKTLAEHGQEYLKNLTI